jgi:hypothetical protein
MWHPPLHPGQAPPKKVPEKKEKRGGLFAGPRQVLCEAAVYSGQLFLITTLDDSVSGDTMKAGKATKARRTQRGPAEFRANPPNPKECSRANR